MSGNLHINKGYDASCLPSVTAVGGTYLVPETTNGLSGGGFSDYFERPSYQDAAVKEYLLGLGSTYKGQRSLPAPTLYCTYLITSRRLVQCLRERHP